MATRRPDLEALEVAMPGYLAGIIAPALTVPGKGGTLYYADLQSDQTAQTNRSAGAAPTTSTLAESSTSWTCTEAVRRANIDDAARELLGGLARAEQVKARQVKRSVMEVIEELVAEAVLNQPAPAGHVDILGDAIAAIALGVETLEDKAGSGRIAFVASKRVLNRLKRYADVVDRMKYTGVLPASVRDVRNVSNEQLAACLGVDQVLAGNLRHWYTQSAVYQDRAALVMLPDPALGPDEQEQFARMAIFPVVDQAGMILIESYHDDNLIADVVQARAWKGLVTLNPEHVYMFRGIDADNAMTTSTTT